MGRPKKIKPYRVSYIFPRLAVNGKSPLRTRIVPALDVEDAKSKFMESFKRVELDAKPRILKVYHHYKDLKPVTRPQVRTAFYGTVPPQTTSGVQSLTATVTFPRPDVYDFTGVSKPWVSDPAVVGGVRRSAVLDVRPVGKCAQHPDAVLEADGRCPALDAGYVAPQKAMGAVGTGALAAAVAKVEEVVADLPESNVPTGGPIFKVTESENEISVEIGCEDPDCEICRVNNVGAAAGARPKFIPDSQLGPNDPCPVGYKPLDDGSGVVAEDFTTEDQRKQPRPLLPRVVLGGLGLLVIYLLLKSFHFFN